MLEIGVAFNKSSTRKLVHAALRSFSDLQYTNSLTLPINTAHVHFYLLLVVVFSCSQVQWPCKKMEFGHILDMASLSVLESCMMQMEILMKMKVLVEGLLRTEVQ